MSKPEQDAWLVRPSSIRLLWRFFWLVLGLTVAAQFLVPIKGSFGVDGWFAFGAIYGFLCCLVMVLVAKALGYLVKRDEQYYQAESDDA